MSRGLGDVYKRQYLMSDFKGITQDTLFLMQLNRFNDSKAFYEENKEKIKANMTVPMRQIAASLSDMMLDIDPFMTLYRQRWCRGCAAIRDIPTTSTSTAKICG